MKHLLILGALLYSTFSQATIYYVSNNAGGNSPAGNNSFAGTSWTTAKFNVQNAIALASPGDEIWIKAGTYYPTQDAFGSATPADNRDKTFYVPDGVKLYGGFTGTETGLYMRRNPNYFINSFTMYQTILSGDLGTLNNNTDNSYHVVTAAVNASTGGITLDGLIIKDGNANAATGSQTINSLSVPRNRGGAITLYTLSNSDVAWTINNCIFLNNTSSNIGGGITTSFGDISISNSMFSNNTGTTGGAINYGSSSTAGDGLVQIENTVFASNIGTSGGGALSIIAPLVTLYNTTFFANTGLASGAIRIASAAGTVTTNNTLFYNNTISGSATTAGADILIINTGVTRSFTNCFLQLASIGSYTGTLSGCTFGNTNPSFTNTADLDGADNRYFTMDDGFSLQAGSSAIGAGSNSALGSLTKDLAFTNRMMGTVDVGAYEAAGTGKVRWVNNVGATRPATVTVDAVSQNVYPSTYTSIEDAADQAISGDIIYVTNGNYRNPIRLISSNCAISGVLDVSAGGGQDMSLYVNISKSNIMVTSETGDYKTSSANLFGYGFNIMPTTNVTIRGFNMDSVRVNAFFNSNCCSYGTTSRVSILNNKIKNTRGHGIKTDDGAGNANRKFWAINGNWFENIGFYTPTQCVGTAAVSAIWMADAGDTCEIKNNTIINTKWAGFLCTGFGKNNLSGTSGFGKLTVSGNKVSKTVNAGIQIGFPLANFYYPENADILDNYITEANTGQQLGIGAITMLYSELPKVRIMGNHISNSYNGLAIDMPGWRAKTDTTIVSGNNFCNLVAGSFAVTHKAGYSPNCGPPSCNTRDDLAKYKFENNYWGSPCGPTYPTNPGGKGEKLRRDSTLNNVSLQMSLNDFNFTPFATTPFTVAAAGTNICGYTEIDVKGNNLSIVDGDNTPSAADSTDFGTGSPRVRRFKIFNTGNSLLSITSIVSSGADSTDFAVSGAPSTVAAGDSASFTVTFTAGAAGTRSTTIKINNNDCNESLYDFTIQAFTAPCTPPAAPTASGVSICSGTSANLSATGVGTLGWYSASSGGTYLGGGTSYTTPSLTSNTTYYVQDSTCAASTNRTAVLVTVNPTQSSSFSQTICSNQSYTFNGAARTSTGAYLDTFLTFLGCDSIVTLNLTVNPTKTGSFSQSICSNQSYTFNGAARTTSGAYLDTLIAANGCDSVVTLNLTVNPTKTGSFSQTICSNQSYTFNGVSRTTTGAYLDTFTASNGCDSVVTLNLTVNPTKAGSFSQTICSNQSYTFNGIAQTTAGAYLDTLIASNGCDSLLTLNLTVNPVLTPTITISTLSNIIYPSATVTLTAAVTNAGTSPTYQWKKNGANVGTNDSFYITNTLLNNDSVWCVLSNVNNTCQTSSTATSNTIKFTIITSTPPVTIPYRLKTCTMDSFNNIGIVPSGLAGCSGTNADDDKFFIVNKPAGYTNMHIVVSGSSNFSLVFEVFSGTNISNFVSLACVNSITTTANEVETILLSGLPSGATTYGIRVYDSRVGGGSNGFRICVHTNNTTSINTTPCTAINSSTANGSTANGTLSAYDQGIYGGSISSPLSNPPYGPNLVYYTGSTAFAPFVAGAPLPTCGSTSATPNRVFYSFRAPSMSGIGVTLRTGYFNTSKPTIMEVMSATGSPCPTSYNIIKCSTTGTLDLTPADLAAYQGQLLYVQLTENGALNYTMNFRMSVQGNAPAFSIDSINTNGMRIVLPISLTNLSSYKIYYRITGSAGFTVVTLPPSATSYKLTSLLSGSSYEVWVAYSSNTISQVFMSPKQNASTLAGCSGTLPAPTAVTAPSPNTSCTKVLVTWPSFANAGTAFKYRLYYRVTGSAGYSVLALNDTFKVLTLALNTSYDFFYKAICTSGFVLSSTTSLLVTCGTPKNSTENPIQRDITINGITYHNVDFREFVLATEGNIPVDGNIHDVNFYGDKIIDEKNMFEVFPNPAKEMAEVIYFAKPDLEPTIELISIDGRTVQMNVLSTENLPYYGESNLVKLKTQLDLSKTPAGMYLIRIMQDGQMETKQLIIIK